MSAGRALVAGLALLLCAACGGAGGELGFGRGDGTLVVERVDARAGYLDVSVVGTGIHLRSFTPDDEVCRRVLEQGKHVGYLERGIGGRFTRGDEQCDATGIGDPRMRGARRPREGSLRDSAVPRRQAHFRTIHQDRDVLMLRGSFPLTDRLGFSGGRDSIAVVPNSEPCRAATVNGITSIEYRATGRNTLALVYPGGLCRIEGLIIPRSS